MTKWHNSQLADKYLNAVIYAAPKVGLVLQEVLSKPGSDTLTLSDQEFWELNIEESDHISGANFKVRKFHIQWSVIDSQMMWEEIEWECWPTLHKAKERCEEWSAALAAEGFSQSDLEL